MQVKKDRSARKKLSLKPCEIKKDAAKQTFSKKVEKITRKGFFVMPDFGDNGKKRLFFWSNIYKLFTKCSRYAIIKHIMMLFVILAETCITT